jgi:hypothetical protein
MLVALAVLLMLVGVLLLFGSFAWLIIRGARDGAFPDPLLLITGVSLIAYLITRWDRAWPPIVAMLMGFCVFIIGTAFSS